FKGSQVARAGDAPSAPSAPGGWPGRAPAAGRGLETAASARRRALHSAPPMGQLESRNPATGELLGTVETIEPADVEGVVAEVAEVQPFWAQLGPEGRGRYLRRVADVLVERMDEVAELLSREQGKPIVESYTMEVV